MDLEYARYFYEQWPGDCFATMPTPWGARLFDRQRAIRGLNNVKELRSKRDPSSQDETFNRIKAWLLRAAPYMQVKPVSSIRHAPRPVAGILGLLSQTGFTFGTSTVRSAPRGSIYVNTGQLCWAMPWLVSWLRRRPDIKPVFMVHDAIPLERPELMSERTLVHGKMMDAVARYAAGIIVPTVAARESILNELRKRGRTEIALTTVPHPVAAVFLEREAPDPDLLDANYFVVCGTIEPRKNHRLLFAVWQELVRQRRERAPKLVVIGSRGHGAGPILKVPAQFDPHGVSVIHVSGLSSPALRRLMFHAKALLMPSLAEGFGLPIIEALAVGTPVIASNIPAHHEAGGGFAVYCDPYDARAWIDAVCVLADEHDTAKDIRRKIAAYRPLTAREYFERVGSFLESFCTA